MSYHLIIPNPLSKADSNSNLYYDFYREIRVQSTRPLSSSPGVTAFGSLFASLFYACRSLFRTSPKEDTSGFLENLIQACNLPLGIASSLGRATSFLMFLISGISIATLSFTVAIFGFVFLSVEFGLQLYRLIRSLLFNSDYNIHKIASLVREVETCSNNIKEYITKHQKELSSIIPGFTETDIEKRLLDASLKKMYDNHFRLTAEEKMGSPKKVINRLQSKINRLSRVIHPKLAVELNEKANSSNIHEKKELLYLIDKQINKTVIIHTIAMLAILLATISLTLSSLAFPPLIPITIGIVGATIEFGNFVAVRCWLDQKGYKWHSAAVLPQCLQKKLDIKPTF